MRQSQKLEDSHVAGETVLIADDFNAQRHYGRWHSCYAPSFDVLAEQQGHGEWTADGTPGATPLCGGNAEVDLMFVRESAPAGPYRADSFAVPTSCTGVTACSDHRIVVGTVTVEQRRAIVTA